MKGSHYQGARKRIGRFRHVALPEQSVSALGLLTHTQDKRVRWRIIGWYCVKDKILFFFVLSMLCGLTIYSLLIIAGEYHLYVKTCFALSIAYLIRKLTTYLLKYV
jgi:hypothetical protein